LRGSVGETLAGVVPDDKTKAALFVRGVRRCRSRRHSWAGQNEVVPSLRQDDGFDPLDYPWTASAPEATKLSTEGRTLVVAVGSNASPAVLARKLAAVEPTVPMAECVVTGIAVGHSAHVSAGGYVPAAPYDSPTARTPLRAGWFTPEQLAALDATEPNYERVSLATADYPLRLDVEQFDVYRSRWGVLALDEAPLGLMAQADLLEMLRLHGAADPAGWSGAGLVRPDGLKVRRSGSACR
jgi:hypothetical protein